MKRACSNCAAAQLFGQLLGDNLKVTRKPISDPGRNAPYVATELENRVGSRILPEWMDVVDDPSQTEWRGQTLLGHYLYDVEGVKPEPLTLVEYPDANHGFNLVGTANYRPKDAADGFTRAVAYLQKYLVPPAKN